jgi:hypothetical protein
VARGIFRSSFCGERPLFFGISYKNRLPEKCIFPNQGNFPHFPKARFTKSGKFASFPESLFYQMREIALPKSFLEAFLGEDGFSGSRGPHGLRKGPGASEAKTFENLTGSMKENDPFWEGVDFPDSGAQMGSWPARASFFAIFDVVEAFLLPKCQLF